MVVNMRYIFLCQTRKHRLIIFLRCKFLSHRNMTISNLLHSPQTPLTLLHKPHNHHTRSSFLKSPSSSSFFTLTNKVNHHQTITTKSKKSDSADYPDRLISAICYFYPFFDGIQYGKYVITQFTPIQLLIQPLIPAIKVFKSFPFNGFLVFLTLYFVVVRNTNFSQVPRLPIVAEAADRQAKQASNWEVHCPYETLEFQEMLRAWCNDV
ncbi:hypothetical protein CUMW_106400 [Citrus unshiu]|nr:hypothetical protein CUMW_106400 [Citrus unshiu]